MTAPNKAEEVEVEKEKEQVLVDVTPKQEQQKQEARPSSDEKLEKLHRRMEFQARQFERAMEEIRNISKNISSAPPAREQRVQEVEEDEVDREAQKDWKRGVKMLVTPEIEKTVQTLLEKREAERAEKQKIEHAQKVREDAMARVLEAHPEVEDESSEFCRVYAEEVNKDNNLLSNPLGPEIAMHRAERRLKTNGNINTERGESNSERIERLKTTHSIPTSKPTSGGRLVLTTEEKRICDEKGIKYDEYVKMRNLSGSNFREGVSVDE
jgi:hypothetical protein